MASRLFLKEMLTICVGAPFSLDGWVCPALPSPPALACRRKASIAIMLMESDWQQIWQHARDKVCQDPLLTNGHWDWHEIALANHLAIIQKKVDGVISTFFLDVRTANRTLFCTFTPHGPKELSNTPPWQEKMQKSVEVRKSPLSKCLHNTRRKPIKN